jgi:imidazoleglycerol-phosphate dehydratase
MAVEQAPRKATVTRETRETRIEVDLALDGSGETSVQTGIGMFDHLVEQIGKHGLFDLGVRAQGDLHVDPHHTVEDTGIALGRAFAEVLGDRAGIVRMADRTVPLDEALASVAVDVSGRGYAVCEAAWSGPFIGELPADLIAHFLDAFAREAGIAVYARVLAGAIDHHKAEALFKALGRALGDATRIEPRLQGKPASTKGTLET